MDQHPVYRFDEFVVDPDAWQLSRDGQEVHLDPVVLKLLIYLIANQGRLVTRQELMDTVWGDTVISESALTKAVARLRKALGDDSATHRYLETVRSRGYRFVAVVEEIESPNQHNHSPGKGHATIVRRALWRVPPQYSRWLSWPSSGPARFNMRHRKRRSSDRSPCFR